MKDLCSTPLPVVTLGLLLTISALGQAHTTVQGNTLESMMGQTNPNAMNQAWQTALMAAAFNSDEKLVKELIERKANVNIGSKFGMTALMYASGLPVVKLLLRAGALVNDKNLSGRTALHYATQRADAEVVGALIDAGADVNAKDDNGMTALQIANLELSSDNFADKDLRDTHRMRVQKVIDLLVTAGAKADRP
jgi:ankyrin repeat protein